MKLRIRWVLKASALIILLAAVIYLHVFTVRLREDVVRLRASIEAQPEVLLQDASVRAQLQKSQGQLNELKARIPTQENLASVASAIEEEGRKHNVSALVEDIKEEEIFDDNGKLVKQTGPLLNVHMRIVASGNPSNLTEFLHAIEHLPFLLFSKSWNLIASKTHAAQGSVQSAPAGRNIDDNDPEGLLEIDAIISVQNDS